MCWLSLFCCKPLADEENQKIVFGLCRPLFNAVMCRRYSDFIVVSSLSGLDEGNLDRANYNFRHVALTYQLYLEDDSIVDEDEVNRRRRIKLVTKLLAKIVGESVSVYKVYPAQAIYL